VNLQAGSGSAVAQAGVVASRGWGRVARAVGSVIHAWRASLQVRVITSTLVVGTGALAVLGVYLSNWIADGMYDQRVDQLLSESAANTGSAQSTFSNFSASTPDEVEQLVIQLISLQTVGRAGVGEGVVMLRSPGNLPQFVVSDRATVDAEYARLISPELRAAVRESEVQQWMPVAIPVPGERLDPDRADRFDPGVVVGSRVILPQAGNYELYYLYNLSYEQQTLAFVQRVLALAAVGLVLLLGAMTWLVTRQAVQPVRSAARVAERLTDGLLSERMTVRGVDEMATLAASFNEMADSLQDQIRRMEDLSRLQRRFVSDVSHELRTPLTTIRMASEVLYASRDGLDAGAARSAELLRAQLDRFEALLADLLEMSRFDAGAAPLDAERRDLRDVVVAVIDQAVPIAARRGVWLAADLPGEPTVVDIDPRRVERILRNLLVNAIEHAEERPVEVRVARDARAVAVTVRDHGIGMTPEEAEHVFDRFWRADVARARSTGGTGLGLAISIEDAHLHGGWLEAWGRPGHGACFRLTLPRRAGITLTGSPLPLVPEDADGPAPEPQEREHDPANVPDLDRLEA
jgi:two-component system sensor histidine kinase MtrB